MKTQANAVVDRVMFERGPSKPEGLIYGRILNGGNSRQRRMWRRKIERIVADRANAQHVRRWVWVKP